jgi:AcrR family transcriptional regulator
MVSAMPARALRRRRRSPRFSDDALLDAAAEVFRRAGFQKASMLAIAQEAGATKPTLYARFGSKERLYDRVLERTAGSLMETMSAAYAQAAEADPYEAAALPARVFFAWARTRPTGFFLLFATEQSAPTGVDHRERALDALTELITRANSAFLRARGLGPGRATGLLAAYFVGVLHRGALWAAEHDARGRFDISAFTAQFILQGLGGVSPEAISSLRRRAERRGGRAGRPASGRLALYPRVK